MIHQMMRNADEFMPPGMMNSFFGPIAGLSPLGGGQSMDDLVTQLLNASCRRPTPAARDAVASLKKKLYDRDEEENSCHVCFEEYRSGDESLELPCGHEFHIHCIEPWFKEHNNCPVCRFDLPVEGDGSTVSGSEDGQSGGESSSSFYPEDSDFYFS